ncbi:type II toxin-antitoxin system VapC family toxin [Candidatus Gottesmanbacteria bacterium]|nr:type II toxin-antitoxin system VapC family toxin [Candidatus Gottesmanbacteria bacterium]
MVILDTSIIIDHLRQKQKKETLLEKIAKKEKRDNLAVSIISIQELYEGKSTADKQKEEYLLSTISPLTILPYTYEIAQLAGIIARDKTSPTELADAAISATAIINNAPLFTLDRKDFGNIEKLKFYQL